MNEQPHVVRRAKSTGFDALPIKPSRGGGAWQGSVPTVKKDNPTKPLIDWFAKKLGQNRGTRNKLADARLAGAPFGLTDRPKSILARGAHTSPTIPLPRARQRSSAVTPSIRLSTHRPGSTKTRNSGRSYQPSSIFSPARHRACPRASFITRSSASPTHSPSLSPSSSSQSLASSYLALEDPDSRSYVATLDLPDENASTQPIPPSRPHSPALSAANSLPSSMHFHHRGRSHSVEDPSRSASQATSVCSSGFDGKTVCTAPSIVSTKPTTIFTGSQTALGFGQPFAPISVLPRQSQFLQVDDLNEVPGSATDREIHTSRDAPPLLARALTWTSLSAMPIHDGPSSRAGSQASRVDVQGSASRPSSPSSSSRRSLPAADTTRMPVHVPGYSCHDPHRNPAPYSRPRPDASTHTLASSTYALGHKTLGTGLVRIDTSTSIVDRSIGGEAGRDDATARNPHAQHVPTPSGSELIKDSDTRRSRSGEGDQGVPHPVSRPHELDLHTGPIYELQDDPAGTNTEYARILYSISKDPRVDERASLIALRGRRGSRGSDASEASRFSWAAASVLSPAGDAGQAVISGSRPSSISAEACLGGRF
jgi:hypothetical protein